uniref:Uncharacterized protein n=1 Tax=Arundo donax TaxID=35708 RepID=A0A0A9CP63_ARUDO
MREVTTNAIEATTSSQHHPASRGFALKLACAHSLSLRFSTREGGEAEGEGAWT